MLSSYLLFSSFSGCYFNHDFGIDCKILDGYPRIKGDSIYLRYVVAIDSKVIKPNYECEFKTVMLSNTRERACIKNHILIGDDLNASGEHVSYSHGGIFEFEDVILFSGFESEYYEITLRTRFIKHKKSDKKWSIDFDDYFFYRSEAEY